MKKSRMMNSLEARYDSNVMIKGWSIRQQQLSVGVVIN